MISDGVLVMGTDVNHPDSGNFRSPSVAVVVGSTDTHGTKYVRVARSQKARVALIPDLKSMTTNLLQKVAAITERRPKRIVMFRAGVSSEGQLTQVLRTEVKALRDGCTEFEVDYAPAITFIIVKKRHNTRFFCQDRQDQIQGNIPAGTVVDTVITQALADFYLCSHKCVQGTSKPTHYTVLWDDSNFSMDMLQMLTNAMCHSHSRCTQAISIPAPAYYAHRAAYRARLHLAGLQDVSQAKTVQHAIQYQDGSSGSTGEVRELSYVDPDDKEPCDLPFYSSG